MSTHEERMRESRDRLRSLPDEKKKSVEEEIAEAKAQKAIIREKEQLAEKERISEERKKAQLKMLGLAPAVEPPAKSSKLTGTVTKVTQQFVTINANNGETVQIDKFRCFMDGAGTRWQPAVGDEGELLIDANSVLPIPGCYLFLKDSTPVKRS